MQCCAGAVRTVPVERSDPDREDRSFWWKPGQVLPPAGAVRDLTNEQILTVTGAILVLALAALTVDFSAARFRSPDADV